LKDLFHRLRKTQQIAVRDLQSRKEQGKKSAVYKNGRRVEDSKLVKERRHDFRKLEEWSVCAW
jgi:hypothetical protein